MKFDLSSIVTGMIQAFDNIATKDPAVVEEGYKLFEAENNTLKGNDTVDSDTFKAAIVAVDYDVSRFQDLYNTANRILNERIEMAAKLAEEARALAKDGTEFSNKVKAALEEARKNGESTCTISFVPHRVFKHFTGHVGNRDVTDHVKGSYLKGKIDPVKRTAFRKVTVFKLDPKKNAKLWAEIIKANAVHSLPFILGDSHCRQYATCVAAGDEGGFRMEHPDTWEVTVIEGYTDEQTLDFIYACGSKDAQISSKDSRVIEMKRHKFDMENASKFVLSPWKTAFKVAGVDKGNEKLGFAEFKDAISAIDTLKISLTKGGKASQGVKAAMLKTHKDCTDDEVALSKWISFWSTFFNEDGNHPAAMSKAINKLCGSGYGSEAKTLVALLNVYGEVPVSDLEAA
ncbi:hypothetical protein PGN61_21070 [Klebsiella aerogenes]